MGGQCLDAPQYFFHPGHHEYRGDFRVFEQVLEGFNLDITDSIGEHEVTFIQDLHEPWRVPLG